MPNNAFPFKYNGLAGMYEFKFPDWELFAGEPTRHPELDWMRATADYIAVKGDQKKILEFKAPGARNVFKYLSDDNAAVQAQIQHQMFVLGIDHAELVVFDGGSGDLAIKAIDADFEFQKRLVQIAHKFMVEHLIPGVPPSVDGSKQASEYLQEAFPKAQKSEMKTGIGQERWVSKLMAAQGKIKAAQIEAEEAKNKLKEYIGSAPGIEGDFGKIYWKESSRTTTDWRAIADEAGASKSLIKKHTRKQPMARSFRSYLRGDDVA